MRDESDKPRLIHDAFKGRSQVQAVMALSNKGYISDTKRDGAPPSLPTRRTSTSWPSA